MKEWSPIVFETEGENGKIMGQFLLRKEAHAKPYVLRFEYGDELQEKIFWGDNLREVIEAVVKFIVEAGLETAGCWLVAPDGTVFDVVANEVEEPTE